MPAKAPLRPTVFPPKYRFMKLLVLLLGMLVLAPRPEELFQVRVKVVLPHPIFFGLFETALK